MNAWKDNLDNFSVWCQKGMYRYYYELASEDGKFRLCQHNGSLSSVKTYASEAEAKEDGWYIYKGVL